ncbi:MAG: hypothetical protein WC371_00940 [Parachlamydiales bacterium]
MIFELVELFGQLQDSVSSKAPLWVFKRISSLFCSQLRSRIFWMLSKNSSSAFI